MNRPVAQGKEIKLISVVLPQFHPIPLNDRLWGKGFTEWTNVTKTRPLFKGHHQPHLPGELGFYDLRVPEVRAQQAALAVEHGIHGFCYYHYWFNGERLLERPFKEILASGEPDFPFCLCWANENWTRAWAKGDRDILMQQNYGPEDDLRHIHSLLPAFADRRYIRIDGKPLFIFYRADHLPDPRQTFDLWRNEAIKAGIGELCLARFEADGGGIQQDDPRTIGLDLAIEFTPDWRHLGGRYYVSRKAKLAMALGLLSKAFATHNVHDYQIMVDRIMSKPDPAYPFVRCVSPGFDNSPRRASNATILYKNSPRAYQAWLERAINWTPDHNQGDHRMVFINAWNEWAEGNHLEPDALHGRAYLEATRAALTRA